MNTATTQNSRKKTVLVTALVACLVLAIGGGVLAWFNVQNEVTNTFTQGTGITDPEVDPKPDPDTDPDPDSPNNPQGNITETEWDNDSPLTSGSVTPKNPNVGVGKDSAPAYVFVMVENNLPDTAYFALGDGWRPVDGYVTPYTGEKNPDLATSTATCYKSGLFVYTGVTSGTTNADWKLLAPQVKGATGNYTGELFDKIYTTDNFIWDNAKNNIKVSAYLASASGEKEYTDSNKSALTPETKASIENNVKDWAASVKAA